MKTTAQLRALLPPDPVDQTTARINALNATLAALAESGRDPCQQSKEERADRRRLRKEVYEELYRLVGPDLVENRIVVQRPVTTAEGAQVVTSEAKPFVASEPAGAVPEA